MWQENSFFNSNLFVAVVTIFVGLVAYLIYSKQKRDYKRDAAKLILQEIRYAEQQIRTAKEHSYIYYLASKLLPTNSWHKNIYLFIGELKETQIDLISRFYSSADYMDKLIGIISDKKTNIVERQIFSLPNQISQDNVGQSESTAQQVNNPMPLQEVIINESLSAEKILKEVSSKIEFIYNTPVVERLREISERKWYQITCRH